MTSIRTSDGFFAPDLGYDAIETDRLLLRPFRQTDIAAFRDIYGDPETMKYMGNGPCTKSPAETALSINRKIEHRVKREFGLWCMVEKEKSTVIGHCGLAWFDLLGEVEVAYLVKRTHWNKGFATEGIAASLAFGFGPLNLDRIVAIIHPDNLASRMALEKCGMIFEKQTVVREFRCVYYAANQSTFLKCRRVTVNFSPYRDETSRLAVGRD